MGMEWGMDMEMERYEMGHCLAKKRSWSLLLVSVVVVVEKGLIPIRKGSQSVHLPSEVGVGMKWNGMEWKWK